MESERESNASRRTVWGVGPKIMVPGFLAFAGFGLLHALMQPLGTITFFPSLLIQGIGLVMLLLGVAVVAVAVRRVEEAFERNELLTEGLYRYVRHPMYAGHFFLVWPGIALLFRSWMMLLGVAVMILLFFCFIRQEERNMEEEFGQSYRDYRKRTPLLFPLRLRNP